MVGWFTRRKFYLGFYLTNQALSACLLEKQKKAIAVLKVIAVNIEQGDDLRLAFKQIRARLPKSIQHCTLNLAFADVQLAEVSVSTQLTDQHIMQYLYDQQQKLFSHHEQELVLDYQAISADQQTKLLRCVAVSQQLIDQVLSCAKQQKFLLRRIGVGVFALPAVLRLCQHFIGDQLQGVVLHFQQYFLVMLVEGDSIRQIKVEHNLDFITRYQQFSNLSAVTQWFYWDEQSSKQHLRQLQAGFSVVVYPLLLSASIINVEQVKPSDLFSFISAYDSLCNG